MDLPPDLQELIDQYLNEQLKGETLRNFEAQIAADKALAAEVEFQREMQVFLADSPENELRKTLQQLNAEVTDVQEATPNKKWWSGLFLRKGNNNFFEGLLGMPQLRLAGLAIVLLMISWWFSPLNTTNVAPSPSIAVLPFLEADPQKNQAYFGTGFAEEMLNTLTEVQAIRVAGQTSSFAFKNEATTIAEIGDKLQVTHVLKGSVRRQNKKLKVTATLVTVADGAQVWSDSYDKELDDIFAIRAELLEHIITTLLSKIAPEQLAKLRTPTPATGEVYDLFLKAKHIHKNRYKSSRDLKDFRESEALFKKAISIDATYALAHAGLADLYDSYWVQIQGQEGNMDKLKYRELMEQESEVALQLAPENAYVNQVRGYVLQHLNEPEAAFQRFLKSYRISPKNPEFLMGLSNLYLGMGLHEDALQLAEQALLLDPLFKSAWTMKVFANFYLSRWEKTQAVCQSFLEIDSNNQTALEYLFRTYFLLNQKEKALEILPKIKSINLLGLDLELALLQADSSYVLEVLASNNPNLVFDIYTYQGAKEKATTAYQQATKAYLMEATLPPTISNSLYLDHLNNPRLKSFQDLDWFQEVLNFEKEKYNYLIKTYPRASDLLNQ